MGQPLDTSVKGSPGTCTAMADWLNGYANAAHGAGGDVRGARGDSESGWQGPAGDAFRDAISNLDSDNDALGQRASTVAGALNDFAGALNVVHARMAGALDQAQAAGLVVNGPYIYPPDAVGPAPNPPSGSLSPAQAQAAAQKNAAAVAAHQQAVSAYNAKAAAFNEAKDTVDDARRAETAAHQALEQSVSQASSDVRSLPSIGLSAASYALSYVKSFHSASVQLFDKAQDALKTGQIYQKFNSGNLIQLTTEEQALINWGVRQAGQLSDEYTKKATTLEQFVGKIPEPLRKVIAATPADKLADSTEFLKYTKGFLKGMPYVGEMVSAGSQALDAMDGEKSWGRASADFAASSIGGAAGGAAGGALMGALMGSEVPGIGTIIGGAAGAFLGSTAATDLVDAIADPAKFDAQGVRDYENTNYNNPNLYYPG